MVFNPQKIIATLPNPLSPDTVYFVRTGAGFDLYCSDSSGSIAHKINTSTTDLFKEEMVGGENLTDGDFINIYSNNGTRTARKAVADNSGKVAYGFVLANSTANSTVIVYTNGVNTSVTGNENTKYYLSSTTAGLATSTPPTDTAGNFLQVLGFGTGGGVFFEFNDPIYFG